mmetsp:Transcript_11515/g.35182  ORF Transcript_11515/g.35182 Transcript_11515/m.35182 type:complete len:204 (+) Transcript_11515:44-655(+)
MAVPLWVEIVVVVVSYTLTTTFLVLSVFAHASKWMYGYNISQRKKWTMKLLKQESDSLLGVQTFRNVIMSSSFLATAVLGVASFFLSAALNQDEQNMTVNFARSDPLTAINPRTNDPYIPPAVKPFLLFAISFVSFFFMTQSIRVHMHLGFSVKANSDSSATEAAKGPCTTLICPQPSQRPRLCVRGSLLCASSKQIVSFGTS